MDKLREETEGFLHRHVGKESKYKLGPMHIIVDYEDWRKARDDHFNLESRLSVPEKNVDLVRQIAQILAKQYWNGTQDGKKNVEGMDWEKYQASSNWDDAARGVFYLIKSHLPVPEKGIDWDGLRKDFFNDCTMKVYNIPTMDMHPHNVFEWFKKRIQSSPTPSLREAFEAGVLEEIKNPTRISWPNGNRMHERIEKAFQQYLTKKEK
jgi:hypothetical protein